MPGTIKAAVAAVLALLVITALGPMSAVPARAADGVTCADLAVIGARGSGDKGPTGSNGYSVTDPVNMGPVVATAFAAFLGPISDSGRTVETYSVPYPARAVGVLPVLYFAGLDTGQSKATEELTRRAMECPNQRFVLAGYSQGAMVMHRVWRSLAPTVAARVDAVVLIADGDAVPNDTVVRLGTAPAGNRGIGLLWRGLSGSSARTLPAARGQQVISVCQSGDIVCDAARSSFPRGKTIHVSYAGTDLSRAAGTFAANRVLARPYATAHQTLATVGQALTDRLSATVVPAAQLQWRLAAGSTLPSGLTLAGDGTLSGTPTTAGATALTAQVRSPGATSTAGQWVSVALSITVSEAPTPPPTPPPTTEPPAALPAVLGTLYAPTGRLGFEAELTDAACPADPRANSNTTAMVRMTADGGQPVPGAAVEIGNATLGVNVSHSIRFQSYIGEVPIPSASTQSRLASAKTIEYTVTCYLAGWFPAMQESDLATATPFAQSTYSIPVTGDYLTPTVALGNGTPIPVPGAVHVTGHCDPSLGRANVVVRDQTAPGYNPITYGYDLTQDDAGDWKTTLTDIPPGTYYVSATCSTGMHTTFAYAWTTVTLN